MTWPAGGSSTQRVSRPPVTTDTHAGATASRPVSATAAFVFVKHFQGGGFAWTSQQAHRWAPARPACGACRRLAHVVWVRVRGGDDRGVGGGGRRLGGQLQVHMCGSDTHRQWVHDRVRPDAWLGHAVCDGHCVLHQGRTLLRQPHPGGPRHPAPLALLPELSPPGTHPGTQWAAAGPAACAARAPHPAAGGPTLAGRRRA